MGRGASYSGNLITLDELLIKLKISLIEIQACFKTGSAAS